MLQQFMRQATLLQDTSMFLEETVAQRCLHGGAPSDEDCTGLDACSSAAESEWEEFDMSAYMDLSPQRRRFSEEEKLEPCESLVRALFFWEEHAPLGIDSPCQTLQRRWVGKSLSRL